MIPQMAYVTGYRYQMIRAPGDYTCIIRWTPDRANDRSALFVYRDRVLNVRIRVDGDLRINVPRCDYEALTEYRMIRVMPNMITLDADSFLDFEIGSALVEYEIDLKAADSEMFSIYTAGEYPTL